LFVALSVFKVHTDLIIEVLDRRFQEMMKYMTLRFDRIEKQLDQYNVRILNLENIFNKRKP